MKLIWQAITLAVAVLSSTRGAAIEGVTYTNFIRKGPIEVHVVRFPRKAPGLEIQSVHGTGRPVGLVPLSEQLKGMERARPLAGINGDFYQRDGAFAGDPRGLQISNFDMISAPMGSASFWIDAAGEPHLGLVQSALRVTWPDGSSKAIGLNGRCDPSDFELYTPALGAAVRSNVGKEIVLKLDGDTNAVFRPGRDYTLKVVEIREAGNTPIAAGTFVLTMGRTAAKSAPALAKGAVVKISAATTPSMRGVRNAISGGPTLVVAGKKQRLDKAEGEAYQYSSMLEQHPRAAIGWNEKEFFWALVDGRQKTSVGMTLSELAAFMVELGCTEAMNFDGGGSATLWFDGKVRNRPCDGYERPIANALVLTARERTAAK